MSEAIGRETVPEGFRQTQLGPRTIVVPEHWTRVRIKDVSDIVTRGKQPTYVDEPGIPVLNQSCIYWDGYHPENLKYLDEDVAEGWKPKHFASNGDILINSTGQGTLGRALYWDKESGTHAVDSHITRVSVDSDIIDPEYLRYYLESTWGQTMLYVFCVAGSTGQIELSKTDLMSMPLLSPSIEEQRRIADILSTVDEQIQQTDEVIEKTKDLKRGLMQDLLRPDPGEDSKSTKLGNIPNTWRIGRLQNYGAKFISGGTPSRSSDEYFGGVIPWLKTGEIQNTRVYNAEESLTEVGLSESSAKLVPKGSVLVAMYGATAGNVGFLQFEATTNQACCAVITEDSELDNEFLYYQLLFDNRRMKSYAAGSGQQNLSKGLIQSFDVLVPPLEEQHRIASILSQVDEKLSTEQETKQRLQELKRGLMQDLLTGKVRVTTD